MINQEFINLIEKRYSEMKSSNISEDFVDEKKFGGIKIYIGGDKPKLSLMKFNFENDIVYVGSK